MTHKLHLQLEKKSFTCTPLETNAGSEHVANTCFECGRMIRMIPNFRLHMM